MTVLRASRYSAADAAGSAGARDGNRRAVERRAARARGAALEVLLDAARQHRDLAVAEQRPRRVGDPLEEVAVVRDDHQRARPAVEEVLEDVSVSMSRSLVGSSSSSTFGSVEQQPQQLEPAALATGQVADAARSAGRR